MNSSVINLILSLFIISTIAAIYTALHFYDGCPSLSKVECNQTTPEEVILYRVINNSTEIICYLGNGTCNTIGTPMGCKNLCVNVPIVIIFMFSSLISGTILLFSVIMVIGCLSELICRPVRSGRSNGPRDRDESVPLTNI